MAAGCSSSQPHAVTVLQVVSYVNAGTLRTVRERCMWTVFRQVSAFSGSIEVRSFDLESQWVWFPLQIA